MEHEVTILKSVKELLTGDSQPQLLHNVDLCIEDGRISRILLPEDRQGSDYHALMARAVETIDAERYLVLPGLINTHLHSSQYALRSLEDLQHQAIMPWLNRVCAYTVHLTPDELAWSALGACLELALSGCTTTLDMHYALPARIVDIVERILERLEPLGIRYHFCRAGMTRSTPTTQLAPQFLVHVADLKDEYATLMARFHNRDPLGRVRIAVGLSNTFTSSLNDFQEIVSFAKDNGLIFHFHFAESAFEADYLANVLGQTQVDFLESLRLADGGAFFAHGVRLDNSTIQWLAEHRISVASCPTSNARGEGIAPIWEMLEAGVNVCIGVDGPAGNDACNMQEEMKWFRTLQGTRVGRTYLPWQETVLAATTNGARALGIDQHIGSIREGMIADLVAFDMDLWLEQCGHHHSVLALMSCTPIRPALVLVGGETIIRDGKHLHIDEDEVVRSVNEIGKRLGH